MGIQKQDEMKCHSTYLAPPESLGPVFLKGRLLRKTLPPGDSPSCTAQCLLLQCPTTPVR
jgi:hypothetical protein